MRVLSGILCKFGPWRHGGWSRGKGDSLGAIGFESNTSTYYRKNIQAPWIAYYLKDEDNNIIETATEMFERVGKAIAMIDFHLLKHGKVLSCGHHADEGSTFGKACATCSDGGSTMIPRSTPNYNTGPSSTAGATPQGLNGGINIYGPGRTGIDSGPAVTWGGGSTKTPPAAALIPEGGFQRSADPITLINNYLFKHGRILPCGHHASERTDDKDIEDISKEVCLPCEAGTASSTVAIDPTMTADDL